MKKTSTAKKGPAMVRELNPADHNPRVISDKRAVQLGKTMAKFGDLSSITYNRRTGRLVSGHQRVKHLQPNAKIERREQTDDTGTVAVGRIGKWPYREVDWDDKTEKAACIAANAAGGQFDDLKLGKLIKELDVAGFDMDLTGLANVDSILASIEKDAVQEDEIPQPPKTPKTKVGDLYILGEHRLLCGDSAKPEDVSRLMGESKATLIATDPPYGVAYGDETGTPGKYEKIENDENDGPRLQKFLENVFSAFLPHMDDSCAWYLWHAQMTQGFFAAAAAAAAVKIHRQIIWVKPSLVLGHGDYHWRHELCFYGWVEGKRPKWYGDRKQTTVWEIGRENDHIHPTQKPVEIFQIPMRFNTLDGDVCYEPFAGSGSQFIAAESMGRKCFGIEISPAYCDVIVKRWENLTGRKATKEAA